MRKPIFIIAFIYLFAGCKFFTAAQAVASNDSLILKDGKVLVGTVEKKSIESLNNMQLSLDNTFTFLDLDGGQTQKVPNRDVHYFIIRGTRYTNVASGLGHAAMVVILEGTGSIYEWIGVSYIPHSHTDIYSTTNYRTRTTTYDQQHIDTRVMVLHGVTYTPKPKYLQKNFATIFGDCPKLVEEAKSPGFNFEDLENMVNKYNACTGSNADTNSKSKGH